MAGSSSCFWYILPIFLSLIGTTNCDHRNYLIVFDEINLKHWNPDLVEVLKCQITQSNNRSYISGQMLLRHNIEQMEVRTRLEMTRPQTKKAKLYDVRLDACQFLKTLHTNRIFNIFSKSFIKHTNVHLTCPIKAHINYTMTNWYLDEQDFPSYVPAGEFGTITEYFIKKKLTFRVAITGRVVSK